MFSGCSLIAAAGVIANNSIQEILTPHHAPAWFTLLVLIVVVIIKEVLSRRILAVADSLDSAALKGMLGIIALMRSLPLLQAWGLLSL